MATEQKNSAELEREVEAQRSRVESRIGQIQDRLSPGQMVDELLSYAKNSGGGDFIANLGKSVSTNPIPVALMGVSLVWLMAKQGNNQAVASAPPPASSPDFNGGWGAGDGTYGGAVTEDYGYATVRGGVRHVGHSVNEVGERYSEFTDEAGKKFRALSDAAGNRAGHFVDDAGATFRGFQDEAGRRVEDIRDQSGELLGAATGWASDTWGKANDAIRNAGSALSENRHRLQHDAAQAGSMAQQQADQLGKTLLGVLHDQPLVGGALAFAVGAAIASALPHTEQEDRVLGQASDKLKQQASDMAGDAYDQAKDKATQVYADVSEKAAEVYEHAKDDLAQAAQPPVNGA